MTDHPPLRPPHTVPGFVGVVARRLLRSPLHRVMGNRLLLISVTGRISGRVYVLPLSYTQEGSSITASTSVTNAWTKNLRGGAPVRVLLRGAWVPAVAEPSVPTAEDIAWYLGRVPQDAKYHYVRLDQEGRPDPGDLQLAAREQLFIRIQLAEPATA